MAQNTDHGLLVRYLLGELPRYQHKQVEQRFFSDDAFFDRLLEAEEGLINDYLTGRLREQERLQFERNFLNTRQRREKVELYRNRLQEGPPVITPLPEKSPTGGPASAEGPASATHWWDAIKEFFQGGKLIWQFGVACAALALLIGLWVYLSNRKNDNRLASNPGVPATNPTPLNPARGAEPVPPAVNDNSVGKANENNAQPGRPGNTTNTGANPGRKRTDNVNQTPGDRGAAPVIATLVPGLLRDNAQVPVIDLSSGASSIVLKIELQEERHDSYRAVLMRREQGGEDRQVYSWPRGRIRPESSGVSLNLPARRLNSGLYYLELYGSSAGNEVKVERYPFEVIKP